MFYSGRSAVFLDKDGTLLDDVPFNVDPALMRLAPGAREALSLFAQMPAVALIVVSNQPGIARGFFGESAMQAVEEKLGATFAECGARLDGFFYCPHHPEGTITRYARRCGCRKPAAGMLEAAAARHGIDCTRSWMIGDILDDVEAGRSAGCTTVLICNGNETEWLVTPPREPHHTVSRIDEAAQLVAARHTKTSQMECAL